MRRSGGAYRCAAALGSVTSFDTGTNPQERPRVGADTRGGSAGRRVGGARRRRSRSARPGQGLGRAHGVCYDIIYKPYTRNNKYTVIGFMMKMNPKEQAAHSKRLSILREQAAILGFNAPPEIIMEIEEIKNKIDGEEMHTSISSHFLQDKKDTYIQTLEHLYRIYLYTDRMYSEIIGEVEQNKELTDKLVTDYHESIKYISKTAMIGIYISDDAIEALSKYMKDFNRRSGDWVEEMEEHYSALLECIRTVRSLARIDLMND